MSPKPAPLDNETYIAIRAMWDREAKEAHARALQLGSMIRDLDRTWEKLLAINGPAEAPPKQS